MRGRVKEDTCVEKSQRALSVRERNSSQEKMHITYRDHVREISDGGGSYDILKVLTHDEMQTDSGGSWVICCYHLGNSHSKKT